jgi:hypothetical protein
MATVEVGFNEAVPDCAKALKCNSVGEVLSRWGVTLTPWQIATNNGPINNQYRKEYTFFFHGDISPRLYYSLFVLCALFGIDTIARTGEVHFYSKVNSVKYICAF